MTQRHQPENHPDISKRLDKNDGCTQKNSYQPDVGGNSKLPVINIICHEVFFLLDSVRFVQFKLATQYPINDLKDVSIQV